MNLYIKKSQQGYNEKPSSNEIMKISFFLKSNDSTIISYNGLKDIIEEGYSFTIGKYKRGSNSINEIDIEYIEAIALDIDSKVNEINMFEMQSLLYKKLGVIPIISYPTFSDENLTKFRLIYRFENPVDTETYRKFYEALCWKFKKYLDVATKNPNRIWAGTNKKVFYNEKDLPIKLPHIIKIINAHSRAEQYKNKKVKIEKIKSYKKFENEDYIKTEYKEEVINLIINSIDLKNFITEKLGGNFREKGNKYTSYCPLDSHGGDRTNKDAFVIFKDTNTYRCFTHCGTGNIFTVAKMVYKIDNFSQLALKLAEEYGVGIKEEYIARRG